MLEKRQELLYQKQLLAGGAKVIDEEAEAPVQEADAADVKLEKACEPVKKQQSFETIWKDLEKNPEKDEPPKHIFSRLSLEINKRLTKDYNNQNLRYLLTLEQIIGQIDSTNYESVKSGIVLIKELQRKKQEGVSGEGKITRPLIAEVLDYYELRLNTLEIQKNPVDQKSQENAINEELKAQLTREAPESPQQNSQEVLNPQDITEETLPWYTRLWQAIKNIVGELFSCFIAANEGYQEVPQSEGNEGKDKDHNAEDKHTTQKITSELGAEAPPELMFSGASSEVSSRSSSCSKEFSGTFLGWETKPVDVSTLEKILENLSKIKKEEDIAPIKDKISSTLYSCSGQSYEHSIDGNTVHVSLKKIPPHVDELDKQKLFLTMVSMINEVLVYHDIVEMTSKNPLFQAFAKEYIAYLNESSSKPITLKINSTEVVCQRSQDSILNGVLEKFPKDNPHPLIPNCLKKRFPPKIESEPAILAQSNSSKPSVNGT